MLGYGAADAIGASLFADTVASLVVSWTYYQADNVNLRQGWWIAVGSVLGAQVGSYISPHIAESSLGGSFGIFLIITAVIFALRGLGTVIPVSGQPTEARGEPNKFLKILRKNVVLSSLILGFLVGIISGLLGAGGGVMILLILVFLLEYSMHEGVGTSTFIMAFYRRFRCHWACVYGQPSSGSSSAKWFRHRHRRQVCCTVCKQGK